MAFPPLERLHALLLSIACRTAGCELISALSCWGRRETLYHLNCSLLLILCLSQTTSQRLIQIAGHVTTLTKTLGRVEGGIERVEGGVRRVDESLQKLDKDVQRIVRGSQESLMRFKNLLAPSYPYPHLVVVKEIQNGGKRSLWSRLRGVFMMDMALHFVCPFDMSKVPCGDGGKGYRLRKTRGWVEKISPALQV